MPPPPLSLRKSGFMAAGSPRSFRVFGIERKLRFLELARQYWPDISRCAKAVGICRETIYNHLKSDVKFCKEIQEIKAAKLDELESVAAESGKDPRRGFLDRAMILRAHRPELYNPAKVVRVEGYKMGSIERSQRLGVLGEVVDAEIVRAYSTRKERKAQRLAKRLPAGGEAGLRSAE